ncbi:phosphotransferase [Agreia sp. COWG]|uniref:phosphotransferase n=1 Tax=Agreia sp. COWG TaxID=2773266 RepID=UPI001925480E|nr:phosphotransferase [Agreia sp. COWG]CAD6001587.1 APH domain-containing protein [Agreia sp. COWG]
MARSHFTLAALSTAAVPGADVVSTRPISTGQGGRYDSAVVTLRDRSELIVRVPTSQEAETEQSLDLVALNALTAGFRGRLPFEVPHVEGQTPVANTRAVVYGYVPGTPASLAHLDAADPVAEAIGRAIASIHSLPTSVVTDSGLPVQTSADAARDARTIKDRAAATGAVPSELLSRWSTALEDSALWQFQPTVVHGSLSPESFLVAGDVVTGVLGWSQLQVGDPAADLFWLSSAPSEMVATRVFGSYNLARSTPVDRQLRKRARLYAELEIAKWLLHGAEKRDDTIMADAKTMLAGLSVSVESDMLNPLSTDTGQIMAVEEVEEMLRRTPRADPTPARDHVNVSGISED